MLDFIQCRCKKDPGQRYDSARLASHEFIERDVSELRKMYEKRSAWRGSFRSGGRSGKTIDEKNRPQGVLALQRFIKMMIESDEVGSKSKEGESFRDFSTAFDENGNGANGSGFFGDYGQDKIDFSAGNPIEP
jgi:hypothetical protein